jgi:uncharacterized protein with HEPN domain
MNENRLPDYLDHIQEAVSNACDFTEGMAKSDFLADKRTQQAICMNILIIGEAVTKIIAQYPEFIDQHKSVPWQSMRGMRNRIAHGYFDINLDVVWETVRVALPILLIQIQEIRLNLTLD